MLAHLLKYDTAQGGFAGKFGEGKHTVDYKDAVLAEDGKTVVTPGSIIVDGKEITIYAKPNAAELPWGELNVDVVLECTGFYTSKAKASAHIQAGAKKVVISAPAGNDLPTIVFNTNHKTLTPADTVISAASCTTNCLAPMADALNKFAPIQSGIELVSNGPLPLPVSGGGHASGRVLPSSYAIFFRRHWISFPFSSRRCMPLPRQYFQ